MMAIASWVEWPAVPMPPPGPCEADAAPLHITATTIETAARAARDRKSRMLDDVMTISCANELQKIRRQSNPVLDAPLKMLADKPEPVRNVRIHLRGAIIQAAFTSLAAAYDI